MKEIALPDHLDVKSFYDIMINRLEENLSDKLCKLLSSLIAIDYAGRLKSKPDLVDYVNKCVERLKKHLGNLVIVNEDFSNAMNLFLVSISDNSDSNDTQDLSTSKESAIESIIAIHFSDVSGNEILAIKDILRKLLDNKNSKDFINQIYSDPESFYNLVIDALKEKKLQDDINHYVETNLNKLIKQRELLEQKRSVLKNNIGKLSLIGSIFAASSIGLFVSGMALPALVVPAIVSAVKYSNIAADKVINKFDNKNYDTNFTKNNNLDYVQKLTQEEQSNTISTISEKEKTTQKKLSIEELKSLKQSISISDIKKPINSQTKMKLYNDKSESKSRNR